MISPSQVEPRADILDKVQLVMAELGSEKDEHVEFLLRDITWQVSQVREKDGD